MTHPRPSTVDMVVPDSSLAEKAMLAALRTEAVVADLGQRAVTFWDSEERAYLMAAGAIVLAGTAIAAFARPSNR